MEGGIAEGLSDCVVDPREALVYAFCSVVVFDHQVSSEEEDGIRKCSRILRLYAIDDFFVGIFCKGVVKEFDETEYVG